MNEKSFFERNIPYLKVRSPRMWEAIVQNDQPHLSLRLLASDSGLPTLEAGSADARILIHSARDPLEEAERFVGSHVDGSEELLVVVGFALGYHIEEILARNEGCRVLVIELSPSVLRQALEARDLAPLLGSKRVSIIPYSENWMKSEEASSLSTLPGARLLVHRPYRTLFPLEVGAVEKAFSSLQSTREINLATLKRFDRLWTKNTFKNAPWFFTLGGVSELENALQGLPAVVASAGPSVEGDLTTLDTLTEHAVIIAVDSALCPLLKSGITPDFAVSVDPQLINSLSVGGVASTSRYGDEIPVLVTDPAVYPVTLRTYRGTILLTSSVFSPGNVIEEFSGKKGSIAAGGSVSVAAFDLARILGADPIILLGLDLSYESARTHLSGSFVEGYVLSRLTRFQPAPTMYLAPIRSGRPLYVTGKKGNPVLTDRRMLLYRSWFEREVPASQARVINATPMGLGIAGIPESTLKELVSSILEKPSLKLERMGRLRAALKGRKMNGAGARRLLSSLTRTLQNLSRIEALSARAREISEGILRGGEEAGEAAAELNKLDGEILSYEDEHRLLSMVMQESIQQVFSGARGETGYGSSRRLYSSLEESARFLRSTLLCSEKKLKKFLQQDENSNSCIL